MQLDDPITNLKGVGPKTADHLKALGIHDLMDLILYFPRAYERLVELDPQALTAQEKFALPVSFESSGRPFRTRTGKKMVTLTFASALGPVKAMYFNMPYIAKQFSPGQRVTLYGKFSRKGASLTVANPKVLKEELGEGGKTLARYATKENLSENQIKKLIAQVLAAVRIRENLPQEMLREFNYPNLDEAIRLIHNPEGEGFERALDRLKFQELFAYAMKLEAAKERRRKDHSGLVFNMSPRLKAFKEALPYELTKAQARSIREILLDQKKDQPMNRLLQGDVGSGKTVVALAGLFNVVEDGYQGVLMVPTEILARQHYEDFKRLLFSFNVDCYLLLGSTKAKDKLKIKEEIATGRPLIVVGTHALLEDDVRFPNLGLLVTDEQHRFGVAQRMKLQEKAQKADVLVMSATPIPRTLALHLYSDLDLSVIDELPPGRKAVQTKAFYGPSRVRAYELAKAELSKGHQAYVVCPLIEEGEGKLTAAETLAQELAQGVFSDYEVGLIHGRMKAKTKQAVMTAFQAGKIHALVATTVIEVGVNVPNATVMIVENAERFGLSQLHQLRGRVGRGPAPSACYLIASNQGEAVKKRLDIMTSTNDGFRIAEEDLKMRGTGTIFGTQQSGESGLVLADFIQDYPLLLNALRWAQTIYHSKQADHQQVKAEILAKLDEAFHLVSLN